MEQEKKIHSGYLSDHGTVIYTLIQFGGLSL